MAHFDVQPYVRRPRISIYSGIALTIRLLRSAPTDPNEDELEALDEMRSAAEILQESIHAHGDQRGLDLRPFDRRLDGGWASLHGQLVATTRMIGTSEAERAAGLLAKLFPAGLAFLSMKYEPEWVHSRLLLQRIDEEGLRAELVELSSETCLDYIESAHAALGQALGLGEGEDEAHDQASEDELPALGEQLRELADAIASYGRVLAGRIKTRQPETLARFLSAVAPLDAHRAKARAELGSRATNPGEASEDEALDQEPDDEIDDEIDLDAPLPALPGQDEDGAEIDVAS